MDPIAVELNHIIETGNPHIMEMLSPMGKALFFPKGILSQSAEAKEKAHRINATIGIATEGGGTMFIPSVMDTICGLTPDASVNYAPSFGIPDLRKAWLEAMILKNPSMKGKTVSIPVVTNGITHSLSVFADLFIDKDDVIILPDMIWGNYNLIFKLRRGARISQHTLFSETGGFNLKAFEETVRAEARQNSKITVLMNFPQNPSGYSVTTAEGDRIVEILTAVAAEGTNVLAVADDAYFGLFYDAETLKESLFARLCDRHPRLLAIKLDGATKESFVWGLRVGFITYGTKIEKEPAAVYEALSKKTGGCIRSNISNAARLSQSIVLKSMRDPRYAAEKEEKFTILQRRAKRVKEVLADPKYRTAWDVYPFNSGYFMCIRLKDVDAETLRLHMLDKYGVGLISLGKSNLRVAFSSMEENQIPELFDLVLKGVEDLRATEK
ncbi:MAG: aminotransferase class I/II-fold pyridoxal phosphate-dependent enzyme [Thermodesulfobacteriota bacterium]